MISYYSGNKPAGLVRNVNNTGIEAASNRANAKVDHVRTVFW